MKEATTIEETTTKTISRRDHTSQTPNTTRMTRSMVPVVIEKEVAVFLSNIEI